MKKLLTLLLLCTAVLFFSCKTTDSVSQPENLVDTAQEQADETAEQTTEGTVVEDTTPDVKVGWIDPEEKKETEVQKEKIPQKELDEMEVRLAENKEEKEEKPVVLVVVPPAEEKPAEPEKPAATATPAPAEPAKTEPAAKPAEQTQPAKTETPAPQTKPAQPQTPPKATTPAAPAQPAKPAAPAEPTKTDSEIAAEYNFTEENNEESEEFVGKEEVPIVPSRQLTVLRNQYVDIIYPGTGWIYLGEENNKNHFVFHGRKLGNDETMFTLRSVRSGSTVLHFYKNDALTGNYIDDYIEINVNQESAFDTAHVVAPSYADVVPPKYRRPTEDELAEKRTKPLIQRKEDKPKDSAAETKPQESEKPAQTTPPTNLPKQDETPSAPTTSERVQTVIQTDSSESNNSKPTVVAGAENPAITEDGLQEAAANELEQGFGDGSSLLERAQKAYDEKRYADALNLIDQFFEIATARIDEGLYLEGRILEAKSEVQNIKRAIEAYDALVKNWPQSIFWKRANERSIYLKRFYIDIR